MHSHRVSGNVFFIFVAVVTVTHDVARRVP